MHNEKKSNEMQKERTNATMFTNNLKRIYEFGLHFREGFRSSYLRSFFLPKKNVSLFVVYVLMYFLRAEISTAYQSACSSCSFVHFNAQQLCAWLILSSFACFFFDSLQEMQRFLIWRQKHRDNINMIFRIKQNNTHKMWEKCKKKIFWKQNWNAC